MIASTIDRVLKRERKKLEIKGRKGTKPGTFLKHQKTNRLSFSSRRKKETIIEEHKRLNLFELKREITKCQNMLLQIQKQKRKGLKPTNYVNFK